MRKILAGLQKHRRARNGGKFRPKPVNDLAAR